MTNIGFQPVCFVCFVLFVLREKRQVFFCFVFPPRLPPSCGGRLRNSFRLMFPWPEVCSVFMCTYFYRVKVVFIFSFPYL